MTKPVLRLPGRVRSDVASYREEVARFQRGETSADTFRAFHAPMGVYEQRETGRFMVRVRLGAGLALPDQLDAIATLASRHGDGVLHVTTRQDLQIHGVSLADTVAVQEQLLTIGLSARGGGGGTVRNVTACPRALTCPKATFAVAPHAIATAEYLLQSNRSFHLPRKFKIAFSGCSDDCALAAVHDLGFFAHERDGKPGFSVWAGGGLGPHPAAAIRIEQFVRTDQIFHVAEAMLHVFDRLGDRSNRHQARLRYVVRRLGEQGFIAEYRRERERPDREGLAFLPPAIRPLPVPFAATVEAPGPVPEGFLPERRPDRFTLPVPLHSGQIPAAALRGVATIARELGDSLVVATQQQSLLVPGIPPGNAEAARTRLASLGLPAQALAPRVVACTGAAICRHGVCNARAIAHDIESRLGAEPCPAGPPVIRLSGCPSACASHTIAALGFEGRMRRLGSEVVPHYQVLVGGRVAEGQVRFAERLATVPASAVLDLVEAICRRGLGTADEIRPLVERYARSGDKASDLAAG
jgi:sulfite reductase (ferredoxin)